MSKTPLHNCFVECTKCGERTDLNAQGCYVETDGSTWQIQCQNPLCSHIDQYQESDFVCQLVVHVAQQTISRYTITRPSSILPGAAQ
jgi:hypothetical protein